MITGNREKFSGDLHNSYNYASIVANTLYLCLCGVPYNYKIGPPDPTRGRVVCPTVVILSPMACVHTVQKKFDDVWCVAQRCV